MKRIVLVACCIVVAFSSCGKPPKACDPDALMQKAQVCPEQLSLGFDQEFGSATYLGFRPVNTFVIRNGGVEDLVFDSVLTNGDAEFRYTASWADGGTGPMPQATIKGNKRALIQVEFAPKAAKAYQGSITIISNAQNTPDLILHVSGCGLPSDGGTSPCYRDGGLP